MSFLDQFQKQHGAEWTRTVNGPAFTGAMSLVSIEKLDAIKNLSAEDIRDNGTVILAELSGWLQHEAALMAIPQRTNEEVADLGEPTYPTPEQEIADELLWQNQQQAKGSSDLTPEAFSQSFTTDFPPEQPIAPPKKKRGRPPKQKT